MNTESNEAVILLEIIASSLSMIGILFIFITFIVIKPLRKIPNFRCVMYLSIADTLWSIQGILTGLTSIEDNPGLCVFFGFLQIYSFISSLLWTSVFAILIYKIAKKSEPNHFLNNEWKYILFCFGVPLLFALIPLAEGFYGLGEYGCGLKPTLPTELDILMMSLVLMFIPAVSTIIFNIYLYCVVLSRLRRVLVTEEHRKAVSEIKYYPLVLAFCWVWALLYFSIYTITQNRVYWLAIVGYGCCKLQGFFNAFLYGFNTTIGKKVYEYYINRKVQQNIGRNDPLLGMSSNARLSSLRKTSRN